MPAVALTHNGAAGRALPRSSSYTRPGGRNQLLPKAGEGDPVRADILLPPTAIPPLPPQLDGAEAPFNHRLPPSVSAERKRGENLPPFLPCGSSRPLPRRAGAGLP